jgi:hypothetical protein
MTVWALLFSARLSLSLRSVLVFPFVFSLSLVMGMQGALSSAAPGAPAHGSAGRARSTGVVVCRRRHAAVGAPPARKDDSTPQVPTPGAPRTPGGSGIQAGASAGVEHG